MYWDTGDAEEKKNIQNKNKYPSSYSVIWVTFLLSPFLVYKLLALFPYYGYKARNFSVANKRVSNYALFQNITANFFKNRFGAAVYFYTI